MQGNFQGQEEKLLLGTGTWLGPMSALTAHELR